ncbi:MAG TPA: M4 family metallopeptidase [Egibacteraceae bacterium]|nr:M4 family metallopeptidase [Egibacteraceae bacterium]
MVSHPHRCSYIPPHVLDRVARRADEPAKAAARATAQQSQATRRARAGAMLTVPRLLAARAGVAAEAAGARRVYDCKGQWEQQVALARKEGDEEASGDVDVDTVYEHAGFAREFYRAELGRNSIDNQGMDLVLNVHYGEDYMNALWDGEQILFGDGDGEIFSSLARSLEVTAHELTHGVVQFSANLEYYSQSGALDESMADVLGAAVTQHAEGQDAGQADWLIGDEVMGPTLYGEALRSVKAPGTAYHNTLLGRDPQPAHMDDYFTGTEDHQGVHINSGIPNRAFYLTASDVGTPAAGRIWYAALHRLWPTADFNDAVEVIVDTTRELTRDEQAPKGAAQVVRAAFREVGLPR